MQTRSVQCLRHGRPSSGCLTHHRPLSSRACNTHFCPPPGLAPGPALKGTHTWVQLFPTTNHTNQPSALFPIAKLLVTIVPEYPSLIFIVPKTPISGVPGGQSHSTIVPKYQSLIITVPKYQSLMTITPGGHGLIAIVPKYQS